MIRAYVAPTDAPAIWIDDETGEWMHELTLDEAEDLREQIHHATRTAGLECEIPTCRAHQVGGGYCAEHGGRP